MKADVLKYVVITVTILLGVLLGFAAGSFWIVVEPPPFFKLRLIELEANDTTFVTGWVARDPDCVWSGGRGELQFDPGRVASAVELRILARGMVSKIRPQQSLNVIVNGSLLTTWRFAVDNPRDRLRVKISDALLDLRTPLRVALIEAAPAIPAQIGAGPGTAPRSICVDDVSMHVIPPN